MTYKYGSRGLVVKEIQKIVCCYPDGIWGNLTTEAVKSWQRSHSLTPDGIAGPATLSKMGLSALSSAVGGKDSSVIVHDGVVLKKSRRSITDLVIHCTATREGQSMSVAEIRACHLSRGFADIGYHYVIDLKGVLHIGRDVDISGAHVSGHNPHSIGIVYVGGLKNDPSLPYSKLPGKDTRTDAQKSALLSLLMDLRRLYPEARISGHRDFSPDLDGDGLIEPNEWIKSCPCFDAKTEFKYV